MVDTRTRYDSTEDDPVRFGAPATVRFGDFPDEVRPQIKLWRKIAEKSHGNYKAGVSHFSCSFVWRADRRLRTLIGNDATGPCFPVGNLTIQNNGFGPSKSGPCVGIPSQNSA